MNFTFQLQEQCFIYFFKKFRIHIRREDAFQEVLDHISHKWAQDIFLFFLFLYILLSSCTLCLNHCTAKSFGLVTTYEKI